MKQYWFGSTSLSIIINVESLYFPAHFLFFSLLFAFQLFAERLQTFLFELVKNRTKTVYSEVLNLRPHQALSRLRFYLIGSSGCSLAGLPWSAEECQCTESISGPERARLPTQCCREPLISSECQRSEIPQVCTMGFLCLCTSHGWERGLHTQTKNSSICPSTHSQIYILSAVIFCFSALQLPL